METVKESAALESEHQEKNPGSMSTPESAIRTSSAGIKLIPQPSNDPQDPLNWTALKKAFTTLIWSLGAFVSTASGLGNALGYFVQAEVYHKDAIAISYSVVAATAGIAVGPLLAVPLSRKYGRSFIFFWSMFGLLTTGIWSATMTHSDQYIAFVMARLIGGLFGGTAAALGADTIVDLYFLHQRGKGLAVLNISFLSGVVVGPTLSGYISGSAPWTVQFWWSNGLEAAIILLSLGFLEDTYYYRGSEAESSRPIPSKGFFANRWSTFFWRPHITPRVSNREMARIFINQFMIGICPVTLLVGGLTLVDFGFAAFFNIVLTIFLQDPPTMGGYEFTPTQNADFLFCLWFGVLAAQVYGYLANDSIPLWKCRRNGGIWEPEFRLYTLWVPGFVVLPIALGLFGASLQYHLHFMVLALACFLGGYATNSIIPVTVNYVIECFEGHASESAAIMGFYRLVFSLSLPFFVPAWIQKLGFGWCLGMAAFFSIFAFGGVVLLIWKGREIRQLSFKGISSNKGGMIIMKHDVFVEA